MDAANILIHQYQNQKRGFCNFEILRRIFARNVRICSSAYLTIGFSKVELSKHKSTLSQKINFQNCIWYTPGGVEGLEAAADAEADLFGVLFKLDVLESLSFGFGGST